MTKTKTIICETHGEQEQYIIEHRRADGVQDDMIFCKTCRDEIASCALISMDVIDSIRQSSIKRRIPNLHKCNWICEINKSCK
jgi:hypothetical protein